MQGDPTDMNPSPAHTRLRRALPLVVALAIGAAAGAGAYALSSHGSKTPSAAPVVVPAQPASSTSSVDSLTQLYNEDAPGVGVPRLSAAPLRAALPTSVFTLSEAQVTHELAGVRKASQVAQLRNQGDGREELHAAQGLDRLDHRHPAPGLDLGLEFRF